MYFNKLSHANHTGSPSRAARIDNHKNLSPSVQISPVLTATIEGTLILFLIIVPYTVTPEIICEITVVS